MRPFSYTRVETLREAATLGRDTGSGQTDTPVQFLAGGTTLIDLMKLEVLTPSALVDITPLSSKLSEVKSTSTGLRLGAFATMAAVADDAGVNRDYPAIAQSLKLAASAQLRNMATLGGNVLQRTRCPYYRDPSWAACNKRVAGSGCSAMGGVNRNHAVLGVSEQCISQYPGDFAVALVALGATVGISGPGGARTIPFSDLHRTSDDPRRETVLTGGEVIIGFDVPAGPWTRLSVYLKIRDRESYEFAVSSAAVALDLDGGGIVRAARVGLGGMAYRPWQSREAEAALLGRPVDREVAASAARAALSSATTHGGNDFKPELGRRTLERAILSAAKMEV